MRRVRREWLWVLALYLGLSVIAVIADRLHVLQGTALKVAFFLAYATSVFFIPRKAR